MSITLDSHTYSTFDVGYAHAQSKFADMQRGLTGLPLRVESGAFQNQYNLTLLCDTTDIANLRTSLAKTATTGTPPTNLLDMVDEEGVEYNPAASGSGHLNTGVYFISMAAPKPLSIAYGWISAQRFTIDIVLMVNSANLSS